ncbi:hypothetical protein LBMAG48_29990 [Phycisphaerae bacterium]|nr:hypothetical protein LBMAG48_29990 [Phycisphaerae bacterium]
MHFPILSPMRTPPLALLLTLALAAPAFAQRHNPDPKNTRERIAAIALHAKQAEQAFTIGDWPQAEIALREQIRLDDTSWVPRFNLAIALANMDRTDNAATELKSAIDAGFFDLARLQREPSLEHVREHATIAPLLTDWTNVLAARVDARIAAVEAKLHKKPLAIHRDDDLQVIYLSWVNERSVSRVREELLTLATWSNEYIYGSDTIKKDDSLDVPVIIALPVERDFRTWITSRFGGVQQGAFASIGGAYEPEQARLVTNDLGASLRHEFMHALHWRMCTRLGQRHPIWLLEGLATLVEDMDMKRLEPVPSWRTNMAKRMMDSGVLPDLADLLATDASTFNTQRPLAKYAHVRAFFLYLHDRDYLKPLWDIYTTDELLGWQADRSALKALEAATALTLPQLERDFRDWLKQLDEVAEEIQPGMASLAIEVENGPGDGVRVIAKPDVQSLQRKGDTQAIARALAFATGDVLLAIDDKPTRDIAELVRVLGEYQPGDGVRVLLRRGQTEITADVTLAEKR